MQLIQQKYVFTFVAINTENSSSSIFFVEHKISFKNYEKQKMIQVFMLLKVKKIKQKSDMK